MKRRLPNLLTALSLLPLAGIVTLWARSHRVQDGWCGVREAGAARELHAIETCSGGVRHVRIVFGPAERSRLDGFDGGRVSRRIDPQADQPDPEGRLGFAFGQAAEVRLATGVRYFRWVPPIRVTRLPFWFLAFAAATPAVAHAARSLRRTRRRSRGRCVRCGYDLTCNESGVCPECGARSDTMRGEVA